jgi:beta-lactamase class A
MPEARRASVPEARQAGVVPEARKTNRAWQRAGALVCTVAVLALAATAASASTGTARSPDLGRGVASQQAQAGAAGGTDDAAATAICRSARHPVLARRLSQAIGAAMAGRESLVGLAVYDTKTRVHCGFHYRWHFYSASVVKVTILGALLHKLMVQHRYLTPVQVELTKLMIEQSDNQAASDLWAQVGRTWLQRFLNLAGMTHTILGRGGYWGLTFITAQDELTLLKILTTKNPVLDKPSRKYALSLMAHVIASQRWGVPAGTPAGVTVHLKNGWLPLPTHAWHVHSIGAFTSPRRTYMIVVLTENNPTMAYGIATIEDIAEVINHRLNPGEQAVVGRSPVSPGWGIPDEPVPPARVVKRG